MNSSTRPVLVVLCYGVLAASLTGSARQDAAPLPPFVLPAGFQAEVFAEKVENSRSMALGAQGTVFLPAADAAGGRGATKTAMGRPVDVLQMPDGAILISDDRGNRLIRVSYRR